MAEDVYDGSMNETDEIENDVQDDAYEKIIAEEKFCTKSK